MEFWHWLALGFILMGIELVVPSFFFLWLGLSALAVGGLFYLMPDLPFTTQGGLFAVAGIVCFYASRKYIRKTQRHLPKTTLNKRGQSMVGQVVTLETAIENGHGKANVGDTVWRVEGPTLPAGAKVRIVGMEGTSLKVEAA